jgi:protein SCO1/2
MPPSRPYSGSVERPFTARMAAGRVGRVSRKTACFVASFLLLFGACTKQRREVDLHGVVVSVDVAKQEITIQHDDIPHFMPGMTMAFKVRDVRLLDGRVPGDVVRGTLVVENTQAHVRTLERIGSAPVPAAVRTSAEADTLAPGADVPDARFFDGQGNTRRLSDWRGQALAVSFIYTRCPLPNFCPLMDQHFKAVQAVVLREPDLRGRTRLLSVSFDPAHDVPKVLAARAGQLGADPAVWSYLTGEREEIARFAAHFGVSIMPPDPETPEIVHNLRTAVIDPAGRLSTILRGSDWTPTELVAELRKAIARR